MGNHEQRRQALLAEIGEGIAVIPSAKISARNADVDFEFRQNSDFYYLTGFDEPDAVAVLKGGANGGEFHLFVRPKDPLRETWDGPMAGLEGAKETFGADHAHAFSDFEKEIIPLMDGTRALYYVPGTNPKLDPVVFGAMRTHRTRTRYPEPGPSTLVDLSSYLSLARLQKDPDEVTCLRRAGEISAAGHREAMRLARPGLREYQVQAGMEFVFRTHGSRRNGYPSIVASGANATILHYILNDKVLQKDDLLLIDAGAEYNYYTADITRTFPVSGTFTPAQRDVYQVVLDTQRAGVEATRVGGSLKAVHELTIRSLAQGLLDLGALQGSVDQIVEEETYKTFYMHGTGHWLGMDVHDVGLYYTERNPTPFAPGMVTTVEPGLYFSPNNPDTPAAFSGIGIRIEDDILVTEAGPVNLTAQVPTEIGAVETLCQEASALSDELPTLPE